MNQTQIKYARERAANVLSARKKALTAAHTTPAVALTGAERLQAIKDGAVKLDFKGVSDNNHWWHSAVSFTAERPVKVNTKALNAATATLQATYDKLIDELVLGDNEAALALLRAFESGE